ncbi:MAG: hypothetical protein AAFW82_02805 [Pseudomonadota bacterium]
MNIDRLYGLLASASLFTVVAGRLPWAISIILFAAENSIAWRT